MTRTFLQHLGVLTERETLQSMTVNGDTQQAAVNAFNHWVERNKGTCTVVAGGPDSATEEQPGQWSITFRYKQTQTKNPA